ncbi:MAG TPA: glycerol-3-phosphate dehydrogenase/oxidase [Ktedonobacterales bacterium]
MDEALNAATRAANLDRLARDPFDVLVVGGGITGAGVALDAAARGYRVALVEKADFASGTSSWSTKLVHGGIRYLPEFDFALVREALVERGRLIHNAPFLVEPLEFVLPLFQGARRPLGVPFSPPGGVGLALMLSAGLELYDLLAGRLNVARHHRISLARAHALAPRLKRDGLRAAFVYSDAQTNDTRLTLAVLRTAARMGAVLANYAEATAFPVRGGALTGATVRDALTGATHTVTARHVVNATGIYAEQVAALGGGESHVAIEPSKGVHLVVARERVGIGTSAVVIPETDDGRILFVIPWLSRAVIGTTDTGTGDLDHPEANPADVAYLLNHVNRYLDVDLTPGDILNTYAGYRPLIRAKGNTARLSRSHEVVQERDGMVTIVGGKMTTYRRMAQDTVDVLARRDGKPREHPTETLPLAGAVDWAAAKPALVARAHALGLSPDVIHHLTFNYGRHAAEVLDLIAADASLVGPLAPDLPYLRAEVVHACRAEMALRLDDVLARRTRLVLEERAGGVALAPAVADLMADELGWSATQTQDEIARYMAQVRRRDASAGLPERAGEASAAGE